MRRCLHFIVLGASLLLAATCFAQSRLITANDFSVINQSVQKLVQSQGAKHVLVVLDDDDTLTTEPQVLGSIGWWMWQNQLLKTNPLNKDLVADNFQGLVQAQKLILQMSQMELTDLSIPHYLARWQQAGVTTMVLTARPANMAMLTQRQFTQLGLMGPGMPNFALHAVLTSNGTTSYPTDFLPCQKMYPDMKWRDVRYQNGILYDDGLNKGLVLQCFLQKTGMASRYTGILFADDQLVNDKDVYHAFASNHDIHLISVYYTREHSRQQETLVNKQWQAEAVAGWNKIVSTLQAVFKKPNLPASS